MRSKHRHSRNAFTLIEVMVAAILISVVGLSLLQMHHKSAQMSQSMQKKFHYTDWVLMAAFEGELEKTSRQLSFETLMKPFAIENNTIRKSLDIKAEFSSELVMRIDAGDITEEIEEQSDLEVPVFEGLRLEVYAQKVQMEHEGYLIYRLIKP